jgi:hypothetical protein
LTLSPGDNDVHFLGLQALFALTENFLARALDKNADLKAARNSAFSRLFAAVSPGAFALWMDRLLRVGDFTLATTIPHLITFIEARIAFRTAYQRLLARRLLSQDSILTMEEEVLCGMKEALGASFCQPLEKMLHDILTSKEHRHESRKRTKAAYETEILVLASSVWPVEQAGDGYAALNTPISFQHLCTSYEKQYKDKHSRRLLHWHPLLSNVQVDMAIGAGTYSLKLSVAQWTILETLTYSAQDIASVSLKSGLAPEMVRLVLEPLFAVGLVSDALAINLEFAQPTAVLDLMPGHHCEPARSGQTTEELTTEICGPDHASSSRQSYLIQAAIVRHLKNAGTSTAAHITKYVADALAERYHPTEHDLVTALQSLESREFIKQDPRKPSNYHYVP